MRGVLSVGILVFNLVFSFSQEMKTGQIRPVIISNGDTIVHTYILTSQKSYRPLPGRFYYWYYPENIHCNSGGYSGSLLHQEYVVYDKDKNMIEKGSFQNGLKNGIWQRWYKGGILKSVTSWEKGMLNGTCYDYAPNGKFFESIQFKAGKKHGSQICFENDTLIRKTFRNGIETSRKILSVPNSQNHFTDQDTAHNISQQKVKPFGFLRNVKKDTESPLK